MYTFNKLCLVRFGRFKEDGWLRHVLKEVDYDVKLASDFIAQSDYRYQKYIILFSRNKEVPEVNQLFDGLKQRGKSVGVILLSDEWCRYYSDLYARADYFVRFYYCDFIEGDNLMVVPLGPPHYEPCEKRDIVKSCERPYSWFFAGHASSSRGDMLHAMRGVERYFLPRARVSKAEFDAALGSSVFAPCPMGNVSIETWRFYEALEAGCIPIVEKRMTVDYYKRLLGPNPIPTFYHWRDAADWALEIMSCPGLDDFQAEIFEWWQAKKAALPRTIRNFIAEHGRPDYPHASAQRYNSSVFMHSLKWKIFCLRMANMTSLSRRIASGSLIGKLMKP